MSNLPLTVYEFLVYIGTGAVLLVTVSVAWGYEWVPVGEVGAVVVVLWFAASYVTGHVVAHLSGFMIEEQIVRRWFDPPTSPALFRAKEEGWRERWFRSFFRPLPEGTQARIVTEAQRRGAETSGRALFLHCFAIVKRDAVAFGRMTAFVNQYGFCRNMCLIAVFAIVLLATRPLVTTAPLAPGYAGVTAAGIAVAVLMAVVMFYRYLKFYRLYYHEIFVTYAEPAPEVPTRS
jgi:hypothetical protein